MFSVRKSDTDRIRWLTRDEAQRLRIVLPDWLAEPYWFSLYTGLRKLNVENLTWDRVNLERKHLWIDAVEIKTKKALRLPLNTEALAVLRRARCKHPRWVFTRNGVKIPHLGGPSWRTALKKANIDNFHWHDLRHTWASWMAMEGVPLAVIETLGGWSSIQMVERYAYLCPDHLGDYAEAIVIPTHLEVAK